MSKKQIEKNIQLSEKLANYLASNPKELAKRPNSASFVVFSACDESLNRLNERLARNLVSQGKNVIKAEETRDAKNPWVFATAPL